MSTGPERFLICLAGMPGSGKSIVAEVARELGFTVVSMGDAVREEARRRGIEPTGENMRKLMRELRAERGPAVVAELCFPLIDGAAGPVLVEGIRSLEEVRAFRSRYGRAILIAIHSSPRTRFERLRARGRPDDPRSWEEFEERDRAELEVGIGSAIAMADHMLVNEGTVEELREEARELLARLRAKGLN
ncbi:dephospho-CoA kinase [Candidatus Bathyarchaeota archaeon]|nr:MAG: dephospho-CoA kinase [Candidatus Bathyarchaeota archaeon]